MGEQVDYGAAWENYRTRRRFFLVVWIGGFGLAALLIWLSITFQMASKVTFLAIMAAWMISFIIAANGWSQFPCPRCGQQFFRRARGDAAAKNTCQNCGLPFGHNPNESGIAT